MTAEQKQLVIDNHNLIYHVLKHLHISLDDYDDWYGLAAIGLCTAAERYISNDDTSFSTYACVCIKNIMYKEFRHNAIEKRIIGGGYISLNSVIEGEENIVFMDLMSSDEHLESDAVIRDIDKNVNDKLTTRQKRILHFMKLGYSKLEIGKILNLGRGTVWKETVKIRELYKDELKAV